MTLTRAIARQLARKVAATPVKGGGVPSIVVPHATNYALGDYSLYTLVFNPPAGGVLGVDYDATATVRPSTFPDNTDLDWKNRDGPVPPAAGIHGYHHVDFTIPAPTMVCNLTQMLATIKRKSGGSVWFNRLNELWIAKRPVSPNYKLGLALNDAVLEFGAFDWTPDDYAFHKGGVGLDNYVSPERTFTVKNNGGFVTFAPLLGGAIDATVDDIKARLDHLVRWGVLTGFEQIVGKMMFGIEPTGSPGSGSGFQIGKETFEDLSVQFSRMTGGPNRNYFTGTPYFNASGFLATGLTPTPGQADMDGGTTAIRYMEQAGAAAEHSIYKPGGDSYWMNLPSAQMDLLWYETFKPLGGRAKFGAILATPTWDTQLYSVFDTTTLLDSNGSTFFGSGLVIQDRQIIDVGAAGSTWPYASGSLPA